jgi:hypothetical protein
MYVSAKECRVGCALLALQQRSVPPGMAWKRPGLPTEWTPILERNPEAMNPDPLPGYVWLDTPGKVLHVEASRLEFRNGERAERVGKCDSRRLQVQPRC